MDERGIDAATRAVDDALSQATGLPADAERVLTPYSGNDDEFYRVRRAGNTLDAACLAATFPAIAALLIGATGLGVTFLGVGNGELLGYSQIAARALAALAFVASVAVVWLYWRALPEEFRVRRSPALVAILLLVPCVNAIAFFPAICGGSRRGLAALEKLERNRLGFQSPESFAYAAWATWFVAFAATLSVFLVPDVRKVVEWGDVWRAIVGVRPYFVGTTALIGVAVVNLIAYALVVVGAGFYAAAIGRMKEIAARILELRLEESADSLATEESRAKDRAELERIMNLPTSR